jgi:MYXO-CTERM domain-containing protein
MATVDHLPLVSPDEDDARRPSRVRPIVAALLLIALGLLAAASVLASRPYQPAAPPRPTTSPVEHPGQQPDHC